jgi:hypothetical protein
MLHVAFEFTYKNYGVLGMLSAIVNAAIFVQNCPKLPKFPKIAKICP